jgi:putative phosphoribosyl transferase
MRCLTRLEIIEGATHLFEEPGVLDQVSVLARDWFLQHRHRDRGKEGR